jgi:hypothetical protein
MTTIKQPSNNETMTTTHTPGPWYATDTGSDQGLIISEHDGRNIAVTYDVENMLLVAAAPELLAALEGVIHHNDALSEVHKLSPSLIAHVSRAIAKAKG